LARSLSRRILAGTVSARTFPCFRTQAADQARATCTPGTAWPVDGYPPGSSRDRHWGPGSDAVSLSRRFSGGSLAFAFLVPAWRLSHRLFRIAHHDSLQL